MSLTSGLALERSDKPLAYVSAFFEVAVFGLISVVYVLGAVLLCTATSAAVAQKRFVVSTNLWEWIKAAPPWAYLLAVPGYEVLLLVYWLGGNRSGRPLLDDAARGGVRSTVRSVGFCAAVAAGLLGLGALHAWISSAHAVRPLLWPNPWLLVAALPGYARLMLLGGLLVAVLWYFSRVRVEVAMRVRRVRWGVIGRLLLFLIASGVYFTAVAGLYALIAHHAGALQLKRKYHPVAWFAVQPWWAAVMAVVAYVGLLAAWYWFRGRGRVRPVVETILVPLVPFTKSVYFVSVTAAYFLGAGLLWLLVAQSQRGSGVAPSLSVARLLGDVPGWAYALVAAAWMLLIVIYYSPGEEADNRVELRAFLAFLAVAAIATVLAMGFIGGYWEKWKAFYHRVKDMLG